MSIWTVNAVVIEAFALIGLLAVFFTKRMKEAFVFGFNTMALVTGVFVWYAELSPRTILLVAMVALYLLRMNWTLLVWSDQTAISKLDDHTGLFQKLILPVVLANAVGWAYCLPFYFAARNPQTLSLTDAVAATIYVLGTVLHFGSDYQKRLFKLRGEGKLLDFGFWGLCRHPNYLGDFLIYISFAVLGRNPWGWVAPALNLLQYAFDAIPKNEKWAAARYGPAWDEYKTRTKAFLPFLV